MTILITGGTGFLGSHIVHALLKKKMNVVILKRSTSLTWRISDVLSQVKIYNIDVDGVETAFKDQHIDVIIHTACSYGRKNEPLSAVAETNIVFGLKILEQAIFYNADTFFNTDTLLQKHLNMYSLSKKQFVEWLKQRSENIRVVNMKLEHMYGTKDDSTKFIPWVLQQLQENKENISLTSGIQLRDFVFIDDVVSAYCTVLDKCSLLPQFIEYDVGSGRLVSVHDFVTELSDQYKQKHPDNNTLLAFGAVPYREGEMMSVNIDISNLCTLGWNPKVHYKDGIKKLLEETNV